MTDEASGNVCMEPGTNYTTSEETGSNTGHQFVLLTKKASRLSTLLVWIAVINGVLLVIKPIAFNMIALLFISGRLIGLFFILNFLFQIITLVLFLRWKYSAYKNLDALHAADREYTAGSSIAFYFVPLLNLVRPFQVMKEIWKGSDPAYIEGNTWTSAPIPKLLPVWWVFFVLNALAFSMMLYSEFITLPFGITMMTYTTTYIMIFNIIAVPYAITTMNLVKRISENQRKKRLALP